MSHQDVLTVGFLQAHGVVPPKPLRDWLTRVSFLARAQPDEQARERYVKWALGVVEEAVGGPGGVAAVAWAKKSTIRPPTAPERTPTWWPAAGPSAEPAGAIRTALLEETLRRAPAELEPYVRQGFGLYDREVARGQRSYEQVTFVEMLNIARSLHAKAPPPPPQPIARREEPVAAPPTAVQPAAAPPPAPKRERSPPRYAAEAEPPSSRRSALSSTHKRSATADAPEPPLKRPHVPTTATATTGAAAVTAGLSAESVFFQQLTGAVEADKAPPPVFVGQSVEMERAYTRYEPLVEDIRPLPVLKKAFDYLCRRSREMESAESRKAAQKYLSDQLKGLRQDLRVQNIVDDFTVHVYETHARLCLETSDIGEFNQCQAALKQFYRASSVALEHCHFPEFFRYRIVYLTLSEQYDSLSTELINFTNAQLSGTTRAGAEVDKEALNRTLALCNACVNGDPATVCRLLMDFEVEMSYLVRIYLQKLRIMWLKEILTAMKGSLTLRFLMASLGFTPLVRGDGSAFWLDGSQEDASAQLFELFKTLKVTLPDDFVFEAEVVRTKHAGPNALVHYPSLDAASALKAVDDYILYLGTRKDARLG